MRGQVEEVKEGDDERVWKKEGESKDQKGVRRVLGERVWKKESKDQKEVRRVLGERVWEKEGESKMR